MSTLSWLHLSDLHFKTETQWDESILLRHLLQDVREQIDENNLHLDFIALTGDIAFQGIQEEYSLAQRFFEDLLKETGVPKDRLILVPGNHDLNRRQITRGAKAIVKSIDSREALDDVLSTDEDRQLIMRKFAPFDEFIKGYAGGDFVLNDQFYCQVCRFQVGNKSLAVLALNSAWLCTGDADRNRIALGERQVRAALAAAEAADLRIALMHHPFDWLHDFDRSDCESLLLEGCDLILHGHLHRAGIMSLVTPDQAAMVIAAGAAYETRTYPNCYNLVTVDLETGQGMIHLRRYSDEGGGGWTPDVMTYRNAENGRFNFKLTSLIDGTADDEPEPMRSAPATDNGPSAGGAHKSDVRRSVHSKYIVDAAGGQVGVRGDGAHIEGGIHYHQHNHSPDATAGDDLETDIEDYCRRAEALYEKLPLMGFRTKLRVPIRIEDIYVPLRAMLDRRATGKACFADAEDAESKLGRTGECDELALPDAFKTAETLDRRGIVILGDPGSGKTTHLIRLLLWCLRKGVDAMGLPKNMIPVFLPLRELRDLNQGLDAFIQNQLDKPHLGTPDGFGERLVARGKLLFLLDGLDEVADPAQRTKVARWIDAAVGIHKNCRFVVTCRFAGYTDPARLCEHFLEVHIRPLSFEQVKAFVGNWYRIVETGLSTDAGQAEVIAAEKARELIDRISQPEIRAGRVFMLTRNPLLLTNICLVHRDRGNLPHSRDRLYEECTDVLLELWRAAIGYQTKVDARSGRKVLQPAALWLHQEEERTRATAAELAPVIEPALKAAGWPHGNAEDFLQAVRDESGLLTGWDQERYGFMHLGFQEYLAALEIQNKCLLDPVVLTDLAARFGPGWWQEVTLLLLSLGNPCPFVPFMRALVQQPGFTQHPDLVEKCLEDAAETPELPFVELLQAKAGKDTDHWERQLAALKIVDRLDKDALDELIPELSKHPYDKVREWLGQHKLRGEQLTKKATKGGYELIRIPGGDFLMGSPDSEKDPVDSEGPQHRVTVPEFYMGRYLVTNEEYGRYLVENQDAAEPEYWGESQYKQDRQPVVGVSWEEARQYARWAGLRLPSEAQWEYACRAGNQTQFYSGDTEADLGRVGWYNENSDEKLHPVGEKDPNAFGLYDMHGNVWEWVEDDWHEDYEGAPDGGSAWIDEPRGSYRVIRGGCWRISAGGCRSALRRWLEPGSRGKDLGFRLVLLPGQQE